MKERLFECKLLPTCVNGIQFVYHLTRPVDSNVLIEALQQAYEQRLRIFQETWPSRTVYRAILKFEVEYRIGERDLEVHMLHRMSADDATRRRNHTCMDRVLMGVMRP